MGLLEEHGVSSRAIVQLQNAAAGAYVTSLGLDYDEKQSAILDDIIANFGAATADLKRLIERSAFAGILDTAFVAQLARDFALHHAGGDALRWSPVTVELFLAAMAFLIYTPLAYMTDRWVFNRNVARAKQQPKR